MNMEDCRPINSQKFFRFLRWVEFSLWVLLASLIFTGISLILNGCTSKNPLCLINCGDRNYFNTLPRGEAPKL